MSKIKISGKTPEQFKENFKRVIETAAIISQGGYIGHDEARKKTNPSEGGMLWYFKDDHQRYQLSPYNDHWFNIREEKDTYIIGEFNFRYDNGKMKESITKLMDAWFQYVDIIQ